MKNTAIILLAYLTHTRPQTATISPDVLSLIFDDNNVPTTGTVVGTQQQQGITAPTPAAEGCVCVPANFCDQNNRMINYSVSGWGLTNARVGDDQTCPKKDEICCRPPRDHPVETSSVTPDDQCKCVPYYYCDDGINLIHITNTSVTGWGLTAPRLGESSRCSESLEICCKLPRNITIAPHTTVDNSAGCGQSNPNGLDFIIAEGSGKAGFAEYPWVVALLADQVNYIGVGALIHPNVVITAAHVVSNYEHSPSKLRIRAGEWDTQTNKERLPNQERDVREVYLHRDFINVVLFNDIALLRLDKPVDISEHINVICLPEQNAVFDDSRDCVVNGWGKDTFGKAGNYAVILKKVKVNMVSDSNCLEMLRKTKLGPQYLLHYNFVCAGGEEGEDSCEGDGGAPLVCPTGDGRYILTGLVSWGIGCGERNVPGVYTKVAKFRGWVESKLSEWGYFAI